MLTQQTVIPRKPVLAARGKFQKAHWPALIAADAAKKLLD
jgi:hypothetical protein